MAKYIFILLFGLGSLNAYAENNSEVEQVLFQLETKLRLDKLEETQKGLERTQKSLENLQSGLENTLRGLENAHQQLYNQMNQNQGRAISAPVIPPKQPEGFFEQHKETLLIVLICLALLSLITPLILYYKNRHLQQNVENSQTRIILMQESVKGILAEMQKILDSMLFAKTTIKQAQQTAVKPQFTPATNIAAENGLAVDFMQSAHTAYTENNLSMALNQVDKAILELKRQAYDPNLAEALYLKASILTNQGLFEPALAVYNDLISNFLFHKNTAVQTQVAKALRGKSMMLVKLGKLEQAVQACDELIFQFTDSEDLVIRNEVANAWCNKSIILVQLNQLELAIQASNVLTEQFSHYEDEGIQTAIANAWYNKGAAFVHLEQFEQAKLTLNELVTKFSAHQNLEMQQIVELAKQAIEYLDSAKFEK